MTLATRFAWLATLALALGACGSSFRPYALRPVVWADDDRRPFLPNPGEQFNPWAWDQGDNVVFRQLSEVFLYRRSEEAIDVNALDEVPSSSWYTNRAAIYELSEDALRRGACPSLEAPPLPYTIIHGKFGGSSPGAVVRAADGTTHVLKTDFDQPERATAADSIATRIFFAAGYETPCNRVEYVRPEDLQIEPGAKRSRDGDDPFTEEHLRALLDAAGPGPNGTRRVSLSLYLRGEPIGGFRFSGTRDHDPNDVVPHQDRRELRALYVLSGWLNHVDTRAENNMDTWMASADDGPGYVQHVILDAGDSFGIRWNMDVDDALARRFGNAHYLDLEQVLGDIGTLGFAARAYRNPVRGPAFDVFAYYDVERFTPDQWRNGYPNPAFERRTEADCAWMARIIARFGEPELRAIVGTGKFTRSLYDDELVRILLGRRERVLDRYLVRLSPLTFPALSDDGARLCFQDVAVTSGLREASERRYEARAFEGLPPHPSTPPEFAETGARTCMALPDAPSASYRIVDVFAGTEGRERSHPGRVHLRADDTRRWRVVGFERPDSDSPP